MRDLHLARRLTAIVLLAAIGVVATAGVAYRTVERVRIGSAEFDRVMLFSYVIGDTIPAPATLSDAYLLNIALVDASTPSDVAETVALLRLSEDAYRASVARWSDELGAASGADADTVLATLQEFSGPADRFWTTTNDVVIPAAQQGDAGAVLAAVFGPQREAFQQHHDLGDKIGAELVAAQDRQEAETTRAIEHERDMAILIVTACLLALILIGTVMSRRILREVDGSKAQGPVGDGAEERVAALVASGA